MPLCHRLVLVPLIVAASFAVGCDAGRGERGSSAAARTDSVAAPPEHRTASTEQANGRESAPVGDPAPAPAPKQATPQIPQLPFQLPTLPANLRLPFPLPAGLPTAPPAPAAPKGPTPAPQPVSASRVTVFGIQGCGACAGLKSKLAAKHVPFQYVDIDSAKQGSVPHEVYGKVPKTRVIGKTGAVTWVEGDDADKIERAFKS